ncbi:MAG TPA: SRPBCC family protein [Gemmatimonadales bacterium]|nr:SRPBCC family protein [Gemmatimonadales bacterium]
MNTHTTPAQGRSSTDRIEKRFVVRAPRSRVWRAISTVEEFGAWFNAKLDGRFAEGLTVRGQVTVPGYEHVRLEMQVERMEPERYFAYRWHPYPSDPRADYSAEPTTLVEFRLQETAGGTAVTITESGFDRLPASRRAEAFRMNEAGWASQSKKLAAYVG